MEKFTIIVLVICALYYVINIVCDLFLKKNFSNDKKVEEYTIEDVKTVSIEDVENVNVPDNYLSADNWEKESSEEQTPTNVLKEMYESEQGIEKFFCSDLNTTIAEDKKENTNKSINLEVLESLENNNQNDKDRTRSRTTPDIEQVGGGTPIQEIDGLGDFSQSRQGDNGGGSTMGGYDVGDGYETSAVRNRRGGEGDANRIEGGVRISSSGNISIKGAFGEKSLEVPISGEADNSRYIEDRKREQVLSEVKRGSESTNSIGGKRNRDNRHGTIHGERMVQPISLPTTLEVTKNKKYSNEEISDLISNLFTIVYPYETLELKDGVEITEEIRNAVASFKPGGVTKQGRGILDEYYTDKRITDAICNLIKNSFSDKGEISILEPSIGTGNFITSINKLGLNTKITGFETSGLSAGIAKVLHPEVEINIRSFETEFINYAGEKTSEKDFKKYDLIIGNPPYGERSSESKGLGEKLKTNTWQEYFVERGLDSLNHGGILAMVLPSGWINKQTKISGVDLVNAFRLPNGVFKGTDVGTDIIILKKNENNLEQDISKYFENHPEYILGVQEKRKNQYGKEESYIKGKLKDALLKLENFYAEIKKDSTSPVERILYAQGDLFGGMGENTEKTVDVVEDKQLELLDERIGILLEHLNSVKIKSLRTYNEIEKYNRIKSQIADTPRYFTQKNIKEISEKVDDRISDLSEKNLNSTEQHALRYTPEIRKGILKYHFIKPDALIDTATQNNSKISAKELNAFRNTNYDGTLNNHQIYSQYANFYKGKWIHDFYYAEGNIYSKLEQLERDLFNGSIDGKQFDKQKSLLESVLPKPRSLDRIIISPNHEFIHNFILGSTEIQQFDSKKNEIIYKTVPYSLADRFKDFVDTLPSEAFADSSAWEVKSFVDNELVSGNDKERNSLIRERRKSVANDLFSKFLKEELSEDEKEMFVKNFNRNYNGIHIPDYSKFPLFSNIYEKFKGKTLSLTEVQKSGIGRLTTKGIGLLAHEVGYGKTLSGILSMHEAMERGYSNRPLIVVPNDSILQQWIETIYETIPDAKVNVLGNLGKSYDLSNFNVEDGEITIVTAEGFKNIGFSKEVTRRLASKFSYISKNELEGLKNSERETQKRLDKIKETRGIMMRGKVYDWEDFGFDHITFDEVHNANHIVGKVRLKDKRFHSDFRNQTQRTSKLGIDTWMACQYIQDKMNGRNVTLLSATPFTNKPLEYYSILSLIANKRLEELGFFKVNNFFETFMEADTDMEINAKGEVGFKTNVRRFKNNALLRQLLSEFVDIKGDEVNTEIIKPNRINKEYKIEQNDFTKQQYEILEANLNEGKKGAILSHILDGRKISISPYLSPYYNGVIPTTKEFIENSPKLKTTMDLISQNKEDKPNAGQIIYSELAVDEFPRMKEYLIEEVGYNPNEVKIITGKTEKGERLKIQEEFNSGKVKVIIGSSAIQEGMNLQENTTDLYMLSLPYNFTALRQVEGRAWRQGNKWENVRINYMLTNNSVDVFMLQKLQAKQSRFNEAMKNEVDIIDISDIKTEELKTALITDPKTRAEIETIQLKKRIIHEKNKLLADQAFKNRHFKDYFKIKSSILYQETSIKTTENPEFKKRLEEALSESKSKMKVALKKLSDRKLSISDIESQMKFTEEKIKEQDKKIEGLPEIYNNLIEKYQNQRKEIKNVDFIAERATENKTFFSVSENYTIDLKDKNDYKESLKELRKLNVDPPKQKTQTTTEQENRYVRRGRR